MASVPFWAWSLLGMVPFGHGPFWVRSLLGMVPFGAWSLLAGPFWPVPFGWSLMAWSLMTSNGLWAASCKKSIRKNKSTRNHILDLKMCFLVDSFFLIELFFFIDFYMKWPLVGGF